jgi:hypothetical protein
MFETLQALHKTEDSKKIATVRDSRNSIIEKIISILVQLPNYACYLQDLSIYLKLFDTKRYITNDILKKINNFTNNNKCLTIVAKLKYLTRKDGNGYKLDENIFDFEHETKVEKFTKLLETSYFNLTQQELQVILHKALSEDGKYNSWNAKQFRVFQKTLRLAGKREIIFILRQHFEKAQFKTKYNKSSSELIDKTRELKMLINSNEQDAKKYKKLAERIATLDKQLNEQRVNCQKEIHQQMTRNNTLSDSNKILKQKLQTSNDERKRSMNNIKTIQQKDKITLLTTNNDAKITKQALATSLEEIKKLKTTVDTLTAQLKKNDKDMKEAQSMIEEKKNQIQTIDEKMNRLTTLKN